MNKFILSIATLIGTIVGAGIFGIPYTISQTGVLPGSILLIVLGSIFILVMLLYGEIALSTKEKHRLIGYAEKYLGKKGKILATVSVIMAFYATLIAYLIIGGKFSFLLLKNYIGGNATIYSLVFFCIGAIIIFKGIKLVARGEFIMAILLLLVALLLFYKGMPTIKASNLTTINLSKIFLPYGVILFAISGLAAIPEIPALLGNRKQRLKIIIIIGTLIPVIIYGLFALMTIGVSGKATSTEALLGLSQRIPDHVLQIGAIFGVLAVFTSLLIFGLNLTHVYQYDYHFPHLIAFALFFVPPIILFLLGLQNFITLIGSVGALFGGLNAILVILMHSHIKKFRDRKPEYSINIRSSLSYFLILIFQKIWSIFYLLYL